MIEEGFSMAWSSWYIRIYLSAYVNHLHEAERRSSGSYLLKTLRAFCRIA